MLSSAGINNFCLVFFPDIGVTVTGGGSGRDKISYLEREAA